MRVFHQGSATVIAGANGSAIIRATINGKSADAVITAMDVVGAQFVSVNAGLDRTCGITTTGAARCWGFLSFEDLGGGFFQPVSLTHTHVAVPGDLTFVSLEVGVFHTCGVDPKGVAFCWGLNHRGQLGDGTTGSRDTPERVAGGLTFQSVSAGGTHSCGLTTDGEAYCWGNNAGGKLGNGTTTNCTTPVAVAGGLTFASLSAGGVHTCGVTRDEEIYCWGGNRDGELGDGTTKNGATPVRASLQLPGSQSDLAFASVVSAGVHTCGLTTGGVAYCWGGNENGELGDGTRTQRTRPVRVATDLTFTSVSASAGTNHTCAITSDGAAYCWGQGPAQLGNIPFDEARIEAFFAGSNQVRSTSTPLAVSGGLTFASVAPGWFHTCGLTTGGVVYCWGDTVAGGTWRYWLEEAVPTQILGQRD